MNRSVIVAIIVVLAVGLLTAGGVTVLPPAQQTIAALQQQVVQKNAKIRDLRNDKADLQDQVDAQDLVIEDQTDQIRALKNRIANQPAPLDAILARDDDGLWNAMTAIWRALPTLGEGQICGYDKSNAPGADVGLTVTSYSFFRTTGC